MHLDGGIKWKDGVGMIQQPEKRVAVCGLPFHMSHTSHYKTISDSLLNLGNHLHYCASADLFVFIFLLAK